MSLDLSVADARRAATGPSGLRGLQSLTLPVFAATLFLSAFLLFSVQPMFTKMVLPRLGGTPAVWSVAMVVFQGLLLLGYLYAHLSARYLSVRAGALVHLALIAGTFALALPIGVSDRLGRPGADHEAVWLLGVFALSVGLPFFAVAGNGPLLQSWFSRSGHPQAADPYFLYGASNLGSFAALLAYPTGIEPFLTLGRQTLAWDAGFALLAGGIALGAACVAGRGAAGAAAAEPAGPAERIGLRRRAAWVLLALVPSGLLVAVTAHISTDIAAVPFLWVAPLALYLLTFVLAFRDRPPIPHALAIRLWPAAAALLCAGFYWLDASLLASLALHLGAFFAAALMCHGELYRLRPGARDLTAFYLLMSLGGVLGGLFTGLVSPLVFNGIYEYPILIVLALACMPAAAAPRLRRAAAELAGFALAVAAFWLVRPLLPGSAVFVVGACLVAAGAGAIWFERRVPLRSAGAAAALLAVLAIATDGGTTEHAVRSFFGVNRLVLSEGGRYRDIVHGSTVHGTMRLKQADGEPAAGRPEPLSYYSFGGGIDQAMTALRAAHGGPLAQVAVAGLGAGSLACQAQPGEAWTFFEIDPSVIRIARDPRWFRFLDACAPAAGIVTGDARLMLAEEPVAYDAIVLDAFSSDSIPVHLLTVEAFAMYLGKLAPGGAIILNTTNRYLDVTGQVAALAEHFGLAGVVMPRAASAALVPSLAERSFPTEVVMLSRSPAVTDRLLGRPGWQPLVPADVTVGVTAWTDDFSNVLGAMLRKR
ncbi:fused MFS/spermidine synthase [Labrys wisconsinensis]|uniref:Spermidine synthase n=1 Tax=Labrys wisconsinensis TaxID=425677 RepID=A0ABU0JMT0_9HYPH|nr:fused MFS/spermidine synthase [Labrys wisconsinensis]MDQ0474826.1 spermidine synthase [Labrys wisconsinensis]